LEEKNGCLKRVVADLTVQVQILKEVNAKNSKPVEPAPGGEELCGRGLEQRGSSLPGDEFGALEFLPALFG